VDATEVPLGEGCDPGEQNLYEWSASGLSLVNSTPGVTLAAPAGAVSSDGSRIYFNDADGDLHLRDGAQEKLVLAASGGGSVALQTTSADGSVAYLLYGGAVSRYEVAGESLTPVSAPLSTVGVLGASPKGDRVYYLANDGLYTWSGGTATKIGGADAGAATESSYPPATGSSRVSTDGTRLVFVSATSLTGYNNLDQKTGLPDSEVFLYDFAAKSLRCVSCRSNGTRPIGPSTIPGANRNGSLPGATAAYKPRALSADGKRIFFDSRDSLVGSDVNKEPDVYEWQPFGAGCAKPAGCAELISNGRSEGGATFIDASLSGDDAFFVTDASLVGSDPGAIDLYDARVGGGLPQAAVPIPCLGDACQELPAEPVDPALNTLVTGPGNPKVRYYKYFRKAKDRGGRCGGKRARCKGKGKKQAGGKKKAGRR
jgi:hypothetical protein